jgi:hypothetical protein
VPPRKKSTPTTPRLTADDVAALRARVTAGEKPRVVVRTASAAVPAGTRGNVIRVGNASDKEFIVVRLGRDEVPFAPNELGLTTRSKTAAAAPAKKAARPATKAPAAKAPAKAPARPAKAAAKRPAKATRSSRETAATRETAAPRPAPAAADGAAPARRTSRKASRSSSRRGQPPLTVTLRFTDGEWSVEAQRGARRLARASALRPGAVKAFADLVDEPAVREALTETVESCRAVVEERAAKLRAELQAAEASLREYEARRR